MIVFAEDGVAKEIEEGRILLFLLTTSESLDELQGFKSYLIRIIILLLLLADDYLVDRNVMKFRTVIKGMPLLFVTKFTFQCLHLVSVVSILVFHHQIVLIVAWTRLQCLYQLAYFQQIYHRVFTTLYVILQNLVIYEIQGEKPTFLTLCFQSLEFPPVAWMSWTMHV